MTGLPSAPPAGGTPKRARPVWALALFGLLALAGVAGLTALGIWQLERRVWKLDLIERVDARIHAFPVPAPGPESWPSVTAASDEYRRVTVTGRLMNDRETLVQAVSDLGGGFWVMTPLVTDRGFTVLVNRGFVPPEKRDPATRAEGQPQGEVTIAGLLRITEPKGGFLRSNDPAAGRWYSRDVAAIAAAKGLTDVAPYFIDADGTRNPGGWPVGGLTVVSFPNSHLSYALTWFALDLMLIGAALYVVRSEMRRRRA
ncbi:SURF1 family protein (plasmid) [Azospirillum oryzae]|uniref:SURF1-like protein n=1 Tax=Azospirillum oryzae TaxID=286727 RepID=A0A6N1AP77_9PROT|nr:SURF1 family protein [Azospirillum oryzae]KAA0586416.1 SURF1 family protein [Azospirillum oryzae]QKS53521.1 SURF1 family protein [Azospirillum oryzae]GLR80361.1 SURF1-like protein [Azospirillum oryzae]